MSKREYKIHRFYSDVYPPCVFVVVDNRLEELKESFEELNGRELDLSDITLTTAAFVYPNLVRNKKDDYYGFVIVFKNRGKLTMDRVAHEAAHAAFFIADELGLKYHRGECNEEFAYLIGWIADCIDKVKKGNKTTE